MSRREPLYDERGDRVTIVFEVPHSAQGTYRYEREDGRVVHGDAGGEWTLDENGEFEDIVFFTSPLHLMRLRQRGLVEPADTTSRRDDVGVPTRRSRPRG